MSNQKFPPRIDAQRDDGTLHIWRRSGQSLDDFDQQEFLSLAEHEATCANYLARIKYQGINYNALMVARLEKEEELNNTISRLEDAADEAISLCDGSDSAMTLARSKVSKALIPVKDKL